MLQKTASYQIARLPDQRIHEKTTQSPHTIVDTVRRRKLELFGHICRMPDSRMLVLFGAVEVARTTKEALDRRHTEMVRHDTTTGVTPCAGSRDVDESHSWPLGFLNHGTRRRRRTAIVTATIHSVTDRKTDGWTDMMMLIANHIAAV